MQRRIRLVAMLTGAAALAAGGVWSMVAGGDDVGCDADTGPSALVALDVATGDLRWQQRTGDQISARLVEGQVDGEVDGEVEVEAQHHTSRIAAATGEVLSCIDHDPPPEPAAAAVTTSVRTDGELPPLESVGVEGIWELQIAPTADGLSGSWWPIARPARWHGTW